MYIAHKSAYMGTRRDRKGGIVAFTPPPPRKGTNIEKTFM